MITGTSPQNSQINWRHAPQGGVNVSVSVTTQMASNPRSPSLIALKIATRSAQTVSPYVAFSTLQPPKIRPDVARSAAPTRKFEYAACAFSRDCFAAAINASYSLKQSPPQSSESPRAAPPKLPARWTYPPGPRLVSGTNEFPLAFHSSGRRERGKRLHADSSS